MFKKDNKSDSPAKNSVAKRVNKISYDEHFTRTSESIDLIRNSKFVDIGDGTAKRKESEYDKFTK